VALDEHLVTLLVGFDGLVGKAVGGDRFALVGSEVGPSDIDIGVIEGWSGVGIRFVERLVRSWIVGKYEMS
jgi:hypothetical protein